jgi:structural maintenance of chromosomes protein 5
MQMRTKTPSIPHTLCLFPSQADNAKQEIQPLVNAHKQAEKRYAQAAEQTVEFEKVLEAHKQEIKKNRNKYESHDDRIEELLHQLNAMDNERARLEEEADEQRQKIERIEKGVEQFPPLDDLMEQHENARKDHAAILPEYQAAKKKWTLLDRDLQDKRNDIKTLENQLRKVQDAKTQQRQKILGKDPDLKKAYEWISKNRREFRKPVVGPISCEVSTKSQTAADYLEQHVPNAVLKSFVVQDKADYDLIYSQLRNGEKVPVNLIQIDRISGQEARLYSEEKMDVLKREHGVIGYLDEMFDANPVVIEALKSTAAVQKVLIGNEVTQESMDSRGLSDLLSQPKERGGTMRGYCIFTRSGDKSFKYTSSISKYSKKEFIRVDDIKSAKMLSRGAGDDKKKMIQEKIDQEKAEEQKIDEALRDMEEEASDLTARSQETQARVKNIQADITTVKKAQKKVEIEKRKLADMERELNRDDEVAKNDIKKELNQRVLSALKAVKAQSDSQKKILSTHMRATGARLNKEAASADASSARYVTSPP